MMACCIDSVQFSSYVIREIVKDIFCGNKRWLSVGMYLVESVTAINPLALEMDI